MGLSKGEQSRLTIINEARKIYNEFGLELRIKDLADKMGVNQSKVTNHFHSKELLIHAIAHEYELILENMLAQKSTVESNSLRKLVEFSSELMDVQLEYRCAIMYFYNLFIFKLTDKNKVRISSDNRKKSLLFMLQSMVELGELQAIVLEKPKLEILLHQMLVLSISWINTYFMFDYLEGYSQMKPVYLKAKFAIFLPYFTEKGKENFLKIDFNSFSNE